MKKFFAALLMLGAFNSYAGIQVDATRVIYKGDDKSASLPIHNDASEAYMVQTRWTPVTEIKCRKICLSLSFHRF